MSRPKLPSGIRFIVPSGGTKKYTAILPDGKRVSFGDRRYEQYRDSVPTALGGGRWRDHDHNDATRRKSYRSRHAAQGHYKRKYSPAWFSYYFLW